MTEPTPTPNQAWKMAKQAVERTGSAFDLVNFLFCARCGHAKVPQVDGGHPSLTFCTCQEATRAARLEVEQRHKTATQAAARTDAARERMSRRLAS